MIAPWNYPWSIPFGEVAIALMAGNGVVLKPASLTPLIGQRIQEMFERAGLPEGLLRTVHGGGAVGQALVESSAGKIFFTGSVEVGRGVGEECARRMKGSVLELGGKDPQIVCADANLANAISGRRVGRLRERRPDVLRHRARLRRARGRGPVHRRRRARGRGADGRRSRATGTPRSGRWSRKEQYDLVCELVDDAIAAGAKRLCGGPVEVPGFSGHFIAPTVLTGVTHDMRIMREEIFGPVLPIVTRRQPSRRRSTLANDSQFGLGASVWTLDREQGRAHRPPDPVRHGLDQRPLLHARRLPVRVGRREGLGPRPLALEVRVLRVREHQDCSPGSPRGCADVWWQPYDEVLGKAIRASARILYGRDGRRKQGAARGRGPAAAGHRALAAARRCGTSALALQLDPQPARVVGLAARPSAVKHRRRRPRTCGPRGDRPADHDVRLARPDRRR